MTSISILDFNTIINGQNAHRRLLKEQLDEVIAKNKELRQQLEAAEHRESLQQAFMDGMSKDLSAYRKAEASRKAKKR